MHGPLVEQIVSLSSKIQMGALTEFTNLAASVGHGRPMMVPHFHKVTYSSESTGNTDVGDHGSHSHDYEKTVEDTITEQNEGDGDGDGTANTVREATAPISTAPIISTLTPLFSELGKSRETFQTLEGGLYVAKTAMHNSVGSPYQEVYELFDVCEKVLEYASSYDQLLFIGQKCAMMNYLQILITKATDAKCMVVAYFDNIQRGYDSIKGTNFGVWNKFKPGTK
jgi:hypothetical protein